jgi:hypothetical protein
VSETKTPSAPASAAPAPATPATVQAGQGPKPTTELKVSGHLMTLDAGLFCIFTPPGSPVPDASSGLPGIRLTLPPGPAFRPEAITISTFRDDGWLGGWNGAALVRVARGPAQVLVTIYQAPNTRGEPPKLQIMKLADGTPQAAAARAAAPAVAAPAPAVAAPAAVQAPSPPQNTPTGGAARPAPEGTEIAAHVQVSGDVASRIGEWIGTEGSKHWMEGFAIAPKHLIKANDIEYQAVLGRGWLSPWAEGGQYCGSRGMSLPILGLRVRLRGEAAETHDCSITATFVDGSRVGPMDTGEPAQAETLAQLEAFLLTITPRAGATADKPGKAAKAPLPRPAAPAKAAPAAKAPPASVPSKKPLPKAPAGKAPALKTPLPGARKK